MQKTTTEEMSNMAVFYLLCFIVIMAQDQGRCFVTADDSGCQAIASAVRRNSVWRADNGQKIIQWYRPKFQPSGDPPPCSCDSTVGGLGDVSRIEAVVAATVISNSVCSVCPGGEVSDADYRFTTDDALDGNTANTFGPCAEITVYRCRCSKPAEPHVPVIKRKAAGVYEWPPNDGSFWK